ncbi:MAG: ABC transporter ATP-binding protein [Cyclobacteriaceae bacterium]
MSNPSIKVENISKRYRIGAQQQEETLVQQITRSIIQPFSNFNRISSLSKFDDHDDPTIFWALKDINFEVQQGEVLGIIGHNGAGKSTLLKILSRITEPTSGEITLRGRVSALLEVGTGFHPELTGRDNIYMNGTILGMRKREIDEKLDEIIAFSGVEKYLDTPVKFYSSGMRVRLAFSVAAHLEPEILIIDEVLAVGDAEFQKKCLGKMEDVAGQGRTVLFVSHNMESVERLCSRALLLENGLKSMDGSVETIISGYMSKGESDELVGYYEWNEGELTECQSIQLHSIRINDKNQQPELGQPIKFTTEIQSYDLKAKYEVWLHILDSKKNKIISSGTAITPVLGRQTYNAELDGEVLQPGIYSVNVLIVKNSTDKLFRASTILKFQISEDNSRIKLPEKNPAILRIGLNWFDGKEIKK